MRHLFVLGFIGLAGAAHAQAPDAAYFCREEFIGGLTFDSTSRQWRGAVFTNLRNFVLRLKSAGQTGDGKYVLDTFNVTATREGAKVSADCLDLSKDVSAMDRIVVGKNNILRCFAGATEYQFNRANNRFLATYAYGYVNGADNDDDTPYVSGGRCTKIN